MIDIPDRVAELFIEREKEEIRSGEGWSRGVVVHTETGEEFDALVERLDPTEWDADVRFYPYDDSDVDEGFGYLFPLHSDVEIEDTVLEESMKVSERFGESRDEFKEFSGYYVSSFTEGEDIDSYMNIVTVPGVNDEVDEYEGEGEEHVEDEDDVEGGDGEEKGEEVTDDSEDQENGESNTTEKESDEEEEDDTTDEEESDELDEFKFS